MRFLMRWFSVMVMLLILGGKVLVMRVIFNGSVGGGGLWCGLC